MSFRAPRAALARRVILLALVLATPASSSPASEEERLAPRDFAVSRPIEIERAGPLQTLLLDLDVYRRSVEPGLADLRVFDAEGGALPYAIRRGVPDDEPSRLVRPLPVFRLEQRPSPAEVDPSGLHSDRYRIDAEVSDSGAIVRIEGGADAPGGAASAAAWLLDASALDRAVVGLEIGLAPGDGDFVLPLRLEASDDLARFRTIAGRLALARLEQAGHRIERSEFEIPPTRARYLLLTPVGAGPSVGLVGVRARLEPTHPAPRRARERIPGRFAPGDSRVVLFDLGGRPPIDELQVRLEQPNTLVEGRLESAPEADGPWSLRFEGILYSLEHGGTLRSPALAWRARGERHLRLTISPRGGGFLGAPPTLEIAWRPEQLLFVQRGSGSPQLAVGRHGTADGSFSARELLRIARAEAEPLPEATARLGPEVVMAGDAALEADRPVAWRTLGLWALLLASVGLVLGLGLRLLRGIDA